jgi:vacuolar-type H+-ATPase subunit I/STV1
LVEQRIGLLQAEKKQLTEMLQRRDEKSDEVDQKREALMEQQSTLEAQQAETDKLIKALATRLDALEQRLPPPLQSDWSSEADEESSSQLRLQLARLSRMKEFNERTTLHSMRLTEPSTGEEILVKQLYLGLSRAWFASSDGSYRGVGHVDNGIWRWTFRDDISAKNILTAIAITEKQSPAQSIALPVSLASGGTVSANSISAHQETTDHEN